MIAFDTNNLTRDSKERIKNVLEAERVNYFEGYGYDFYVENSVEDVAYSMGHDKELIDKYIDGAKKHVTDLADRGHIDDQQFQDEISDETYRYINTQYVIDHDDLWEIQELIDSVPIGGTQAGHKGFTEHESANFVLTECCGDIVKYVRKGHGNLLDDVIKSHF